MSQTARQGDIVFTTLFSDADDDTVSFSYVCSPTGCPFDVLDCEYILNTIVLLKCSLLFMSAFVVLIVFFKRCVV